MKIWEDKLIFDAPTLRRFEEEMKTGGSKSRRVCMPVVIGECIVSFAPLTNLGTPLAMKFLFL
jgi:hypothetical protein